VPFVAFVVNLLFGYGRRQRRVLRVFRGESLWLSLDLHGLRGERQAHSGGSNMAIEVSDIKFTLKNLSERLANIGGHL
jgi:hypothetical protein